MTIQKITIRVYVECAGCEKHGMKHAGWICVTQSQEAIAKQLQEILAASPLPHAKECAIHEQGALRNYPLPKSEAIEAVKEVVTSMYLEDEIGEELRQRKAMCKARAERMPDWIQNDMNECSKAVMLYSFHVPGDIKDLLDDDETVTGQFMIDSVVFLFRLRVENTEVYIV